MADWATFTGVAGVSLVLLLVLARASTEVLDDSQPPRATGSTDGVGGGAGRGVGPGSGQGVDPRSDGDETDGPTTESTTELPDESALDGRPGSTTESPSPTENGHADGAVSPVEPTESTTSETPQPTAGQSASADEEPVPTDEQSVPILSTPALLANVAASQGVFAALLVTMAWYSQIPASAFGLAAEELTLAAVGTGAAVGGLLYGCNELGAAVGRWHGIATPERLREAMAPETTGGWLLLLLVVLPIVAGFEELLFRGALIGVVNAGFGVSPWLLAVGSSVAFALGHGAQGRLGIVVTGLLGLALAAVFVVTGSLLVVIVAHYVINALEFVVHEGVFE